VENVGAGQGLQPAVLLAYGLAAQATVELCFFHALVEPHDVRTQLLLQPLAAADGLAQAVQLELAQLEPCEQESEAGDKTKASSSPSHCPALLLDLGKNILPSLCL
jgi:hypothetical protein